jgi:hypothetical protein
LGISAYSTAPVSAGPVHRYTVTAVVRDRGVVSAGQADGRVKVRLPRS